MSSSIRIRIGLSLRVSLRAYLCLCVSHTLMVARAGMERRSRRKKWTSPGPGTYDVDDSKVREPIYAPLFKP